MNYHVDPMSYWLKKIGWSRQKPIRRAVQRDEAKIKQWGDNWLGIEKKPKGKDKS